MVFPTSLAAQIKRNFLQKHLEENVREFQQLQQNFVFDFNDITYLARQETIFFDYTVSYDYLSLKKIERAEQVLKKLKIQKKTYPYTPNSTGEALARNLKKKLLHFTFPNNTQKYLTLQPSLYVQPRQFLSALSIASFVELVDQSTFSLGLEDKKKYKFWTTSAFYSQNKVAANFVKRVATHNFILMADEQKNFRHFVYFFHRKFLMECDSALFYQILSQHTPLQFAFDNFKSLEEQATLGAQVALPHNTSATSDMRGRLIKI